MEDEIGYLFRPSSMGDEIFRWEYASKENCSRSLPLDDLQIPQSPRKRYSMPETLEDHEVKELMEEEHISASTVYTYSNEVDVRGEERIESPIRSHVRDQADETAMKITSPEAPSYLWKGQVNIPNVAKLQAILIKILGDCEELRPHLPSNVECVGCISSNFVLQYLTDVKKNLNETTSVLRLQILEFEQSENYMASFNHLSLKNRLTVVNSLGDSIKDLYMMALPKYTPLPRILLDRDAPENEIRESPCLLGIVVRNHSTEDIVSLPFTSLPSEKSIDSSTKSSASSEQGIHTSNRSAQAFSNAIQIPSIIVRPDHSKPLTHTDAMDQLSGYSFDVFSSRVKSLLTTPASKTIKNPQCSPTNDDDRPISPVISPHCCRNTSKKSPSMNLLTTRRSLRVREKKSYSNCKKYVANKAKTVTQNRRKFDGETAKLETSLGKKKSLVTVEPMIRKSSCAPNYNDCKRPCSVLLPILDPEVLSSPVRLDEAGNIMVIKEPYAKLETSLGKKKSLVTVEPMIRKSSCAPNYNDCKRPCSVLLPILDPEVLSSPVRLDEAGNIWLSKNHMKLRSTKLTIKPKVDCGTRPIRR